MPTRSSTVIRLVRYVIKCSPRGEYFDGNDRVCLFVDAFIGLHNHTCYLHNIHGAFILFLLFFHSVISGFTNFSSLHISLMKPVDVNPNDEWINVSKYST